MTMNFVRSLILIDGGFADLHHPEYWDLGWVGHSPLAEEYHRMVRAIDGVRFMETLSGEAVHNVRRVDFYTSHEALLLDYEEGLTRQVPRHWGWFNLSTHYPWICPHTTRGSACARQHWKARTPSTCAESAIRLQSRSARASSPTTCCA